MIRVLHVYPLAWWMAPLVSQPEKAHANHRKHMVGDESIVQATPIFTIRFSLELVVAMIFTIGSSLPCKNQRWKSFSPSVWYIITNGSNKTGSEHTIERTIPIVVGGAHKGRLCVHRWVCIHICDHLHMLCFNKKLYIKMDYLCSLSTAHILRQYLYRCFICL